jgi:hypothetical protein
MAAVVRADQHRHLALEIARGERSVAFVAIEGESLTLCSGERSSFDRTFCFEVPMGTSGIEPTPRHYARVHLKSQHRPISVDAARALLAELSLAADEQRLSGSVILTSAAGALIGSYETQQDGEIAARYYTEAVIVTAATDLAQWPAAKLETLKSQVAPTLKAKGSKLTKELFTMALAAPKVDAPAPKRVQKVATERPAKEDGPVAKIRAFIDANKASLKGGGMTRVQLVDALKAEGINKGTIGVQVPKYLKALGIETVKGSRKANGDDDEVETVAKPKSRKKAAVVEEPAPAPVIKAKGKKKAVVEEPAPALVKAKGKKAAATVQ